ncbi:GNAT family N-acetyltransferase [Flavobacteriaceae bacterium]|nr:GNAT family N-acetyltransferase [Flavobacteriaceae bacterium]
MITHLNWDSHFFGFNVAKIELPHDSADQSLGQYQLLYLINNELQNIDFDGFDLSYTDNRYVFKKKVDSDRPNRHVIPVKTSLSKTDKIEELYQLSFTSAHKSRFKCDPNFGEHVYMDIYRTWIDNTINLKIADGFFLAYHNAQISGMLTFKIIDDDCAKIGLIAVSPIVQGKGVGKSLISNLNDHAYKLGVKNIIVETQQENVVACEFYHKCGFKLDQSRTIQHFWKI